jgi:phage recombination protein Bet
MSTALTVHQGGGAQISKYEDREFIDTIKQTVCRGATDAQLKMFVEVCKSTGLNPFLKEIWYVAEKGLIMAARDGYLRVANENPQFDGIETRVERDENAKPIKAVCTVWRKDRNHPTVCEAYYSEYKKSSPVWQQYPSAMIGKVAEVLALKRSFAINGVVTEEEIGDIPTPQGPPPNSKEAAAAEAEKKLAQLRAQQPIEPEVVEPEPERNPLEVLLEQSIDAMQSRKDKGKLQSISKASFHQAMTAIKKTYAEAGAEDRYYEVLKMAGYENRKALFDCGDAVRIYGVARALQIDSEDYKARAAQNGGGNAA